MDGIGQDDAAVTEAGPLHPVVSAIIAKMRAANIPALSAGTPDEARAILAAGRPGLGSGPAMRTRTEIQIPTRTGSIRALLLVPKQEVIGLCLYIHGGGWVLGTPEDYETLASTLAGRSGCAVLVPDYRLAPEHPFPAGLQDCEDTALWVWRERQALIGEAVPMVVAGDSAGANLAIGALSQLKGRVHPAGLVLIYPVVDADASTPSYERFGAGLPLLKADMEWFLRLYAQPAQWRDPAVSPLVAPVLDDHPPTSVILAEHDVLLDEGHAYARRLAAMQRLVALRQYPGMPHGFIRLHNLVDIADQAVTDAAADLAGFCQR